MIRWLRHLLGYVEVADPAPYGTPWPPATRWVKRRDVPPWPITAYERPGGCTVKMRAPGAISSWNGCDLDAGHEGVHRYSIQDPIYPRRYEGTFTTQAARDSWARRAHFDFADDGSIIMSWAGVTFNTVESSIPPESVPE